MAENSTVDAVIFDGGYGVDYVEFAADIFAQTHEGSTVEVSPSTQIATELQPRFVGGNPPDLVDNSGAQAIGFNTILDQLEDLTDVIDAPNLEGVTIRDTLYGGVLSPGTFDGKLAAINYAFTVYGVWYSGSLFEENGWTPPTNWAEALELGAAAAEQDKYLFCWGREAATYYQTMCVESAIKEGGDEVRLALGTWKRAAGRTRRCRRRSRAEGDVIDAGYMQPGGGGTQFTQAQAQWSLTQDAIMYPSGSWIENEMKEQTAENFQMRGVPTWAVTADSVMPASALRATAGEPFIVPSQGANVAGGKELLRIMLSTEAATNFAETKLAPTIVAGLVPEDGFGSTALVSQAEMLAAAGEDIFNFVFVDFYGTNQDQLPIVELVPRRRLVGRGAHLRSAGHHRPHPRGRLDHQDRGGVTSSVAPTTTAVVAPPRGRITARRGRRRRKLTFDYVSFMLVFLGVPVAVVLVFVVWPFIQAGYYAMTDWTGFQANFNFIGFDNFTSLWDDDTFRKAVRNNILMAIVVPFVTIVIALTFATMITIGGSSRGNLRGIRNSTFYRVVSFFPYVVPAIVIGLIWSKLFDPANGLLNGVLTGLGFEPVRHVRLAR